MFRVLDTEGNFIQEFPSWNKADAFRQLNGRPDWRIKSPITRESTYRQQVAVRFVKEQLGICFTGDIKDFKECSKFLNMYLDEAKRQQEEEYIPEDLLADYADACGIEV